jgi:hypothetical protein
MFKAVEGAGKDVLIIKDNQIVGKGVTRTSSDGCVGVCVVDDSGRNYFKYDVQAQTQGWEDALFHYFESDGMSSTSGGDESSDRCMGTRIVDEFRLQWGLVPDSFEMVKGFPTKPQKK